MGNQQSNQDLQSAPRQQPSVMTPEQRWRNSQQTPEDMLMLISETSIKQWVGMVNFHLKTIKSSQKYQHSLKLLLQVLKNMAKDHMNQTEVKQLWSHYRNKLQCSYFVAGEFSESSFDPRLTSCQKLLFLYEYYQKNPYKLSEALAVGYPGIFAQFKQFVSQLLEIQIIIDNFEHFSRFFPEAKALQQWKINLQIENQMLPQEEGRQLLLAVKAMQNFRFVLLQVVQMLLKQDYADLASFILMDMQAKGYQLSQNQFTLHLKIQLYSLFLYQCGQISMSFSSVSSKSINQIIHLFFSTQDFLTTPQLIACFKIYENPQDAWYQAIVNYVFSSSAHLAIFFKLIIHGHLILKGSQQQYQALVDKLKASDWQVGKYSQQLLKLAESFPLGQAQAKSYGRFVSMLSVVFLFAVNTPLNSLQQLAYADWSSITRQQYIRLEQVCLDLLKIIIKQYLTSFEIKSKNIQIHDHYFQFSTIFGLLNFLQFFSKQFLHGVNPSNLQQILFKQLVTSKNYVDIKALLGQQKKKELGVIEQIVEMIVVQHLIQQVSTQQIVKNQEALKLLLNILGLWPSQGLWHFALSYYHYFKYLQSLDIKLPQQLLQTVSLQHLYFITDTYSYKIDSLDFNFLYQHLACIRHHHSTPRVQFIPPVTDEFLKFKIYLCNRAFANKKSKLGNSIISQIVRFEPPWLSSELVNIIHKTSSYDKQFLMIAFNHCARGQDLQYILECLQLNRNNSTANKYSLDSLKKIGQGIMSGEELKKYSVESLKKIGQGLISSDQYLFLNNDLVTNEPEYKNLVAQMTFNQAQSFRQTHMIFFNLLGVQPQRAFWYALNYDMPAHFIVNLTQEGAKKGVFHLGNLLPYLIKFMYYRAIKDQQSLHIKYKKYTSTSFESILEEKNNFNSKANYSNSILHKFVQAYQVDRILTESFMQLYLPEHSRASFLNDHNLRKTLLVQLRETPMDKSNSKLWLQLCKITGVDIMQLCLFNLISRVNSQQQIDEQCWNIVQKLIHWGQQPSIALKIIKRLADKIEGLQFLLQILKYMTERQQIYNRIATDQHLQIVESLAAVECDKNLYGIISETFFDRKIGIYASKTPGVLSEKHRQIITNNGCLTNIFVLSKTLYFIYGCDQQIEKVILGEFSLKQDDSQEFQLLRKKIKQDSRQ